MTVEKKIAHLTERQISVWLRIHENITQEQPEAKQD